MGFDDDDMVFNTGLQLGLGLGLGLGLHDQSEKYMKTDLRQRQEKREEVDPTTTTTCGKAYPSLTLGPPDDEANNYNNQLAATKNNESDDHEDFHPHDQASSPSAVSSFSNSSASIKRERDLQFVGEEFDVEEDKVPSRAVGDVDENGNPRKKLRLTKEQSAVLEDSFKEHSTLNPKQKQELARKLNLRTRQVEVWFQNRRARTKLKQTEVDCELLKKCCEALTEENKRLQKELQELKSMKTTPPAGPFYMQLPVASVTICPSCERICGGGGSNGSSPTTALLIGSKAHHHHLYKNNYPFTHSSAAC